MNKTELIQAVAERSEEKKATVEKVLAAFLSVVPETLAAGKEEGEEIQITGFGKFSTSYTPAREGRNPQNKDEVMEIPASYRVYFSAGKNFKDIVNDKVEVAKETKTTGKKLVVKK